MQHFIQELATLQEEGRRSDPSSEPSVEDYGKWIEWRSLCIHMANWWEELAGIPGIGNVWELTRKIRTSLEVPWVRSKVQGRGNDYSAPPAPPCICWKDFLPPPDPKFPCWDIREGQSQKTLAYTQALQY